MKTNGIAIVFFVFLGWQASAQESYRQDSLQFKMYTTLYMAQDLKVDSVRLRKVFCDFCDGRQMELLEQEALRKTYASQYDPDYRKPGEHKLALYIRISKEDFKELDK